MPPPQILLPCGGSDQVAGHDQAVRDDRRAFEAPPGGPDPGQRFLDDVVRVQFRAQSRLTGQPCLDGAANRTGHCEQVGVGRHVPSGSGGAHHISRAAPERVAKTCVMTGREVVRRSELWPGVQRGGRLSTARDESGTTTAYECGHRCDGGDR